MRRPTKGAGTPKGTAKKGPAHRAKKPAKKVFSDDAKRDARAEMLRRAGKPPESGGHG